MSDTSSKTRIPVSVIVPCYNCETTIFRAIRSVSEQTQKPHELILVNDGSHDNTDNIIRNLQAELGEDWINIISFPENKGPSYARNEGWNSAVCPYIAFLDSDDSWRPEKLAIQYNYMKEHPDIGLTGHKWTLAKDNTRDSSELQEIWEKKPISKLRFMLISRYFSTPTVMLKKSLRQRFPEDMRYSEDRYLYMKIILDGEKATYLDISLAYLHKSPYGESGLTRSLWKMEKGELAAFGKLHSQKLFSKRVFILCAGFSLLKFLRRGFLLFLKRIIKIFN